MTVADLAAYVARTGLTIPGCPAPPTRGPSRGREGEKASKYHAQPTEVQGVRFDSKAEASYFEHLLALQAAGEVTGFMRQPTFHLPGGTRYLSDFLVFWADGAVTAEDVKGFFTPTFKVKFREVKAAYPWMTFRTVKKQGKGWIYG